MCVCSLSLDTGGRQSPSQRAIPPNKARLHFSLWWCWVGLELHAVNWEWLKQFWLAACSLALWQQVWLSAGVRRGRTRLDSVNKASTSSPSLPLEITYIKAPIKNWCRYNLSSGISCWRIIEKIQADQYYGFSLQWLIVQLPWNMYRDKRARLPFCNRLPSQQRACQILIGCCDRKLSCCSVQVLFNTFSLHGTWFIALCFWGGITLRHCQVRLWPHKDGV